MDTTQRLPEHQFDIYISQREPFKPLFIKTTVTASQDRVEYACIMINEMIPPEHNFMFTYDFINNRRT